MPSRISPDRGTVSLPSRTKPIRLLIADDHELFRAGIRSILERDERFQVVAEASTGAEVIGHARSTRPEIVLLDLSMPGRGGLETAEELKQLDGRIKILVLTANPENRLAVRAFRSGADGYLTKDKATDDLVEAILKIGSGRKYISPEVAEELALYVGVNSQSGADHEALSNRELQVLQRLGRGQTVTEIGADLHLSVKTISTYRARILEKLGLETTAEMIRYAIEEGLVD